MNADECGAALEACWKAVDLLCDELLAWNSAHDVSDSSMRAARLGGVVAPDRSGSKAVVGA